MKDLLKFLYWALAVGFLCTPGEQIVGLAMVCFMIYHELRKIRMNLDEAFRLGAKALRQHSPDAVRDWAEDFHKRYPGLAKPLEATQ